MQKNVLVPYDRYKRLLSNLKNGYSQEGAEVVERYGLHELPPKTIENPVEGEQKFEEPSKGDNSRQDTVDIEHLLTLFPKSMVGRAHLLIKYIRPFLTWNKKGEVIISGQEIPNSNIVDLLKVQLKDYKDFSPVGQQEFERLLSSVNVPHTLLTASRRKQVGGSSLPPPPGIPLKRKRQKQQERQTVKWLHLRNMKST